MQVAGARPVRSGLWLAVLAVLLLAAACDRVPYQLEKFRTARQSRSALALARYLEDDLNHGYGEQAAALLDKHFEFALSRARDHHNGELVEALLGYLRAGRDPRIVVYAGSPTLAPTLSATTTRYFEEGHSWDIDFASGGSLGACEVLDHEVLVFEYPRAIDFEAGRAAVRVDVEWKVFPSGLRFKGPASIIALDEAPAPVEGIGVEVTLRFTPTAAAHVEQGAGAAAPTLTVTGRGVAKEGFEYTAFSAMADQDDVYSGMVSAAFADAVRQILE